MREVKKSERRSFLLFGGGNVTKRTENISARDEKIEISCAVKRYIQSTLAELVKGGMEAVGSQKLFTLSGLTDLCLSFSYWGRFIASSLGRMWMNTLQMEVGFLRNIHPSDLKHLRTHGAIVCVCGVRK